MNSVDIDASAIRTMQRTIADQQVELDSLRWVRDDAVRMERVLAESADEVAKLRQLVKDFVNETCPSLANVPPDFFDAPTWQWRALRVIAECRLR